MDPAALAREFRLTDVPGDFFDDPYRYYALLRTHDPVHDLGGGSIFLTRYEDVAALYRDSRASSDKKQEFGPKFGDSPLFEHHTTSLVFNDPPLHTRVRRLLMGAVNQRAIARMEPDVVALVERLLDRMAEKRAVDLIDDFAAEIPVEVIGNLLEVPKPERGPLRGWSLAILSALEPAPRAEVLERGNRAVRDFCDYLRVLVAERRKYPRDFESDVLTRLIQGEADGERLGETELLHNCIFLLNAGHETTTNLIGNGARALLEHRGELERLAGDPALHADRGRGAAPVRESAPAQQPHHDGADRARRADLPGRDIHHPRRRGREPRSRAVPRSGPAGRGSQAQSPCRLRTRRPRLRRDERGADGSAHRVRSAARALSEDRHRRCTGARSPRPVPRLPPSPRAAGLGHVREIEQLSPPRALAFARNADLRFRGVDHRLSRRSEAGNPTFGPWRARLYWRRLYRQGAAP